MALALKRFDAPLLRCPGMAKRKVGNPSLDQAGQDTALTKIQQTPLTNIRILLITYFHLSAIAQIFLLGVNVTYHGN